jgi:CDGSH-type Zn-finger protein
MESDKKICVTKNGPYRVSGNVPLGKEIIITGPDGIPCKWEKGDQLPAKENYLLCRCGKSKNKPYCDNTHTRINFDGTETASHALYNEQAEITSGPGLDLADAERLCAIALFCHRAGDTWTLTENSGDPGSKATAIQEACDCPSGRLVARDKKTGEAIEPPFEPSISVVEIPHAGVSGPLWVKGGIPIESADGELCESRNRVTLCRCGQSGNKPFCDGTHIRIKFDDKE